MTLLHDDMVKQVILKNLPPSSSLIEEIMDRVKGFLVSKTLLKGDSSSYRPLRHIRGESVRSRVIYFMSCVIFTTST